LIEATASRAVAFSVPDDANFRNPARPGAHPEDIPRNARPAARAGLAAGRTAGIPAAGGTMHLPLPRRPGARCAALLLSLLLIPAGAGREARAGSMNMAGHGAHAMNEASMRRAIEARYGSRTAAPAQGSATSVAATFRVGPSLSLRFDADGTTATAVDTVHIAVGDAVLWQWFSGTHTVTSGTGSLDPNAGAIFDAPSTSAAPQFTVTFTEPGTFPFFCRLHEDFSMRGVVVVTGATSVPAGSTGLGFSAAPSPNPTRGEVSVRFEVTRAGRSRLDVLDVNGRQVAVALDSWLEPGAHAVTWDGRAGGQRAAAGVYFLRLRLPGYDATRVIVLAR
jgi:plastocyanin